LKLVDTNVFIYALGRPHEYKSSCLELLRQFEEGQHDANVDAELLQEILFIFWRRGHLAEGSALVDRVHAAFSQPLPVTSDDVRFARDILMNQPALAPRDTIHAAIVLAHGLEGIISADRGFDSIPGLRRFDPIALVQQT
jgi:predicted nucleic acid-binding protein